MVFSNNKFFQDSLIMIGLLICGLAGCAHQTPSFLTVQLCVSNPSGVRELMAEMSAIAASEHMSFVDDSQETQQGLSAVDAGTNSGIDVDHIIDWHLYRPDGVGVGVVNLGLRRYQVALGFAEGSNPNDAHRFASQVVRRLGTKWRVEALPPGRGASPMSDCE